MWSAEVRFSLRWYQVYGQNVLYYWFLYVSLSVVQKGSFLWPFLCIIYTADIGTALLWLVSSVVCGLCTAILYTRCPRGSWEHFSGCLASNHLLLNSVKTYLFYWVAVGDWRVLTGTWWLRPFFRLSLVTLLCPWPWDHPWPRTSLFRRTLLSYP